MNLSKTYLILAVSSLILLTMAFFYGNPYPTDFNLEQRFAKNKTDFEQLVGQFQKDADLKKVNKDGEAWLDYSKKIKLSEEQIKTYKASLEKLNLQEIQRNKPNSDIYFLAYRTSNLIIGSKSKFYVFTKTEPEKIVNSLDVIVSSGEDANVYKKLEDNWYLYLDIW